MTEQEKKRLEHAKRRYLLKINDTPVVILVNGDGKTIVAGCFEAELNGSPTLTETEMNVPIWIKPIQDETVRVYAHFILEGIIRKIKLDKKKRKREMILSEEQRLHVGAILKRAGLYFNIDSYYDPEKDEEEDCTSVYIDGDIAFDTMAEIVDYLRGGNNNEKRR